MSDFLDKRLIVVAGKGGVGRTVVSLALGRLAERRSRRTLVCLCNAPSRYLDLLGDAPKNGALHHLSPNLDVINLEPKASQEEYGQMILRNRTVHRLIFGSRIVRVFLDAVPGLAEWAMLGKATYHALREVGGRPEYDLVVFDSPSTGHGLDILALPRAILSGVGTGRMRDEAELRVALMEDPTRCEVVPVTVPEEMPINECIELVHGVRQLGLSVEWIVVNMVAPAVVSEPLARFVDQLAERQIAEAWAIPAAYARNRQRSQQENLERVLKLEAVDTLTLPLISGEALDDTALMVLVDALEQGLAADVNGVR